MSQRSQKDVENLTLLNKMPFRHRFDIISTLFPHRFHIVFTSLRCLEESFQWVWSPKIRLYRWVQLKMSNSIMISDLLFALFSHKFYTVHKESKNQEKCETCVLVIQEKEGNKICTRAKASCLSKLKIFLQTYDVHIGREYLI